MVKTCILCGHVETDSVFFDAETCSLCGGLLEYHDDDLDDDRDYYDDWHDAWEAVEFGDR